METKLETELFVAKTSIPFALNFEEIESKLN